MDWEARQAGGGWRERAGEGGQHTSSPPSSTILQVGGEQEPGSLAGSFLQGQVSLSADLLTATQAALFPGEWKSTQQLSGLRLETQGRKQDWRGAGGAHLAPGPRRHLEVGYPEYSSSRQFGFPTSASGVWGPPFCLGLEDNGRAGMSEGRVAKDWDLGAPRRTPGCGARSHAALLRVIWRPAAGAVSYPQRAQGCMSSKWTLCWENATETGNCAPTGPVVRREGRGSHQGFEVLGLSQQSPAPRVCRLAALCLAPGSGEKRTTLWVWLAAREGILIFWGRETRCVSGKGGERNTSFWGTPWDINGCISKDMDVSPPVHHRGSHAQFPPRAPWGAEVCSKCRSPGPLQEGRQHCPHLGILRFMLTPAGASSGSQVGRDRTNPRGKASQKWTCSWGTRLLVPQGSAFATKGGASPRTQAHRKIREESGVFQTFKAKGHTGASPAKRQVHQCRPWSLIESCEGSRKVSPGGRGEGGIASLQPPLWTYTP